MSSEPEDLDFEDPEDAEDVAEAAGDVADPPALVDRIIPQDIRARYDVFSYRSAALILSQTHPERFQELMQFLRKFSITKRMIREAGGNESKIPKAVSAILRPLGWHETIISADLLVRLNWKESAGFTKGGKEKFDKKEAQVTRSRFLDGHKVDYVKDRVAFDLEWNSKDQTFDRDLYAFSAFSECGVIDVGVLVTRSASLNPVFRKLGNALNKEGNETASPVYTKYGASTTWMGKLLYRLNAGRNGSCPVLAFGIKPACIEDWNDDEE
jgi:hypothetical protein